MVIVIDSQEMEIVPQENRSKTGRSEAPKKEVLEKGCLTTGFE